MAKYLLQSSYTGEGLKGLLQEGGSGRRAAAEQAVASLGGKLEAFYFAFGEPDVFIIVDLPDSVSAIALSLAVNAAGAANVKTTVLITPEEMDQGTRKNVTYRRPGA